MISVIIPYYESDADKPFVLKTCTDSLKGYDEIIISSNVREGYAIPINRGLRLAKGDFLIVMNDDLVLTKGSLTDLVNINAVTSPLIDNKSQSFWGCCFCIPRWVYEKVGGLDERYRISYFDDDDYINELRKHDIPMQSVPTVSFENQCGGGRTLHTFDDHDVFFEENKKKFMEKWGYSPAYLDGYFQTAGRLPEK